MNQKEKKYGAWVWPAQCGATVNQYVEFRHEFEAAEVLSDITLQISVDSNYAVRLNGNFVDCGQYHDFPGDKVFDTLAVGRYARTGKNILSIMVYYQGETSFQYLGGQPGLFYELTRGGRKIVSGLETQYRIASEYHRGAMTKITGQLGFSFLYDARKAQDDWTSIREQDLQAICQDRTLRPRPIDKLTIRERVKTRICAQGVFRRIVDKETLAASMQSDYFSMRETKSLFGEGAIPALPRESPVKILPPMAGDDGVYVIFDMGREEVGLLDLEVDAAAGTMIDIAHGEHLDDLRVRSHVGGRNFAYQYICKQGRQHFVHYFKRLAGRYLQLQIHHFSEPVQLYYAGLLPTEYPIERRGSFESCDSLLNKIYETSIRTLHLCMHEHYEDCPWREQALYANDSRNQALCGYYGFGEYDFPATAFDLLGQSLKDDGYLELCAPADIPITIPSFSHAWVLAVGDHWQFRGDKDYVQKQFPRVRKMMQTYLATVRDGLLPCPRGKRYWQFYDWADHLDGVFGEKCTNWGELKHDRYDAPLNALFVMALDAAAKLAAVMEDHQAVDQYACAARELRIAFHDRFWDAKESAYFSYMDETTPRYFAELTQSLALLAGICPPILADGLRTRLAKENNGWTETTLSQSFYKFEALMADKTKFGRSVFDMIRRDWSMMLFSGATSFWETMKGGWDFDNAGSLCHGWSAIPVYFYQAYGLGVRPVDTGFKKFIVDPVRRILPWAKGEIPTPAGAIDVSLEQQGDRMVYRLTHPVSLEPKLVGFGSGDEVIVRAYNP
ncbi:MAG: family 78 glycoside hydrolase catalytic domain [Phycisphaerae bacterium]|nr:family 78 glycoside hydrolase catalytic domain [Phycisphaerae bacterium]